MLSIRTATVLTLTAACYAFSATPEAAPNVAYTASGTFAKPPIHGYDGLFLAGQPFSITLLASEALKPTRHNKTSAEYENVPLAGSISTGFLCCTPFTILVNTNLSLQLGAPGSPDNMTISFPSTISSYQLQFSAKASLPPGTITSPAIAPFNSPVTLTITNATLRYADSTASTTLGIDGTLNAAIQAPQPINVLYSFTGMAMNGDGVGPMAGLTMDKNGTYYGTTYSGGTGYGTVFKLTPPAASGESWTETTLYAFAGPDASDGANPASRVVVAGDGTLYGTTNGGGGAYCVLSGSGCGTIFSLTPPSPPATNWTEKVLYNFTGGFDGAQPSGLVMQGGALFGTTPIGAGCGSAFELAPPAASGGAWQFSVLHGFTGGNGDGAEPLAGLTPGPAGSFYGTTAGGGTSGGTVFQLSPPATPGTPWTETVLYDFGASPDGSLPEGALSVGPQGELYGTTEYGGSRSACYYGCGTVFKLSHHANNTWTESILYSFQNTPEDGYSPTAGVVRGKNGTLYGTALGGSFGVGSVFKLAPPASAGATYSLTPEGSFNIFDGDTSFGGLTFDASGAILGTTQSGGYVGCVPAGCGTIFRLKP